eukprot:TRINITY_DN65889_c0_g1_i1.p2 TRINITY_DN65889_c0_g1~~TRINITY_DN65889_c0_g1_i1.p2  ORF type:complete len:447 (+),score=83.26 TRINITY_DN65889_c0_g1_i1:75-1415(+)
MKFFSKLCKSKEDAASPASGSAAAARAAPPPPRPQPPAPAAAASATVHVPDGVADRHSSASSVASSGVPSAEARAKAPRVCANLCGWSAFGDHLTCCRQCQGSDGPHAKDCAIKNTPWPPLCERGCGRRAFGMFPTCCTRCMGPEGPHTKDCAVKGGARSSTTDATVSASSSAVAASAALMTQEEVLEELRAKLSEWHIAGTMKTRAEVDEVIQSLATRSGLGFDAVRMLWLTVARQVRPVGAPVEVYVTLAEQHHGVKVEVIDLGARSAKHTNSCMFLTCAAALADRRAKGYEDSPPGVLGDLLAAAAPGGNDMTPIEELIEQHRRTRAGTLGRMADALRHCACEYLTIEEESFLPYFSPVRGVAGGGEDAMKQAYANWVQKLREDEEGDELVILALATLLGLAVQPVQQSGYRVPLMDPTEAKEDCILYWGNDDRHWVWLRIVE